MRAETNKDEKAGISIRINPKALITSNLPLIFGYLTSLIIRMEIMIVIVNTIYGCSRIENEVAFAFPKRKHSAMIRKAVTGVGTPMNSSNSYSLKANLANRMIPKQTTNIDAVTVNAFSKEVKAVPLFMS